VKYAGIVSDERFAGRTGLGAVLGWKGLKAISATGSKTVPVCDKEKTTQWCKKWFAYLQSHPLTGSQLPKVGTAGLVSSMQMCGLLRIESGIKEKQFEAATVKDVLEQLTSCGIDRRDLNGCVILVNGNSANKRSKLQDGDTVVLMSPVAGG
jgi:aldehyde:ferredoxin oxidoreductase